MTIADTLRDISKESSLEHAERVSLRKIADEIESNSEHELTEFEKSPMMSECWLVHPIDDADCEECPQVFECREVRTEIERLSTELKFTNQELGAADAELKAKDAEIDRMKDGLERIDIWAQAYPLNIFPKPDLKKAREVLKKAGMRLDEISADTMRHVLEGVKDIVSQALKGEATDGEDSNKI